jgi:AcrR family transcriptional regulator
LVEQLREENGPGWLTAFVDHYVGPIRTCDLAEGCTMQTLASDVQRADARVREVFEARIRDVVEAIAVGLPGDPATAEGRAWSLLAILAGGVTLARAVADPATSAAIAAGFRRAALDVAEGCATEGR